MTATTIQAGRLLARPGGEPARRGVEITVADGRIVDIRNATPSGRADRLLAMPAMVNAHDHGYGLRPLAFGAADDALEPWISGLRGRPPTDPYLEAAVAFARMARGGIATTVHCHNSLNADRLVNEAADVARAAGDVGIRVAFSCPIVDRNAFVYGGPDAVRDDHDPADWSTIADWIPAYAPAEEQLARVEAVAAAHASTTFNVQYGPVGPQWCEDRTLARIAEASARTGRRVHMHLLETRRQREWTDHVYPGGIVRHLDAIGLLSPRLTVAHGVWLDEAECALLAERGVTVAINTGSNLRLRSGLAPVATFLGAGTPFAFGLDGMALDDDQDALRDLRLAYLLHGGTGLDRALTPAALFDGALRAGYRAFDGDGGQGRVAPGANADLLLLDYGGMAADVVGDAADEVDVLLTRMTAGHIDALYVAGRPIVEDGTVTTVDLPALEDDLHARARTAEDGLRRQLPLLRRYKAAIGDYYRRRRHVAGPEASGGGR